MPSESGWSAFTASLLTAAASLPSSSAVSWNSGAGDDGSDDAMPFRRRYGDGPGGGRSSASVSAAAGGYYFGQQPLVHTFETQSSCRRRCVAKCIMQNVEDLMMPRWICDSEQSTSEIANPASSESSYNPWLIFDSQFVLLLVPLALVLFIILIIVLIRRSSSSSSMDDLV
uniref:Uncharacterized protein n=1 Tax=Panagrellus redivivus TaxID=6233 RepID=A0A7E4W122_PANRE